MLMNEVSVIECGFCCVVGNNLGWRGSVHSWTDRVGPGINGASGRGGTTFPSTHPRPDCTPSMPRPPKLRPLWPVLLHM